ncbi:MAG TPA: GNAT family N-acetyltransferase [Ktedonobacterales bacterium]
MGTAFDNITIRDNEAEQRYETQIGEAVAILAYERGERQIALIHTDVPKELEGRGIGGKLAKFALDDARSRGLEVVPICPFVVAYLRRHPDEMDVVAPHARDRVTNAQE